jgi:hypothetical protein
MAVNVVQTALSSRRVNRWLFALGTVVLVAGIVALIVTKVGGSSAPAENANPTGPPIRQTAPPPNIPFPAAAWKVVNEFVHTALPRKNLARSYQLADANMRGGFTLRQWKTGNLPGVPYYETGKVIRYNWKNTNFTHPRSAALNLILEPRKGSTMRPGPYVIFLKKVGQGAKAHWLVDYFGAVQGPPLPTPK